MKYLDKTFSEKLTFLPPLNVSFSENFAYALHGCPLTCQKAKFVL